MKNLFLLLSLFLLAQISFAQKADSENVKNFRYDAKKSIPAGTVLHYAKTNIDGTREELVSQYFASANVIEAFKFHPKLEPGGLVIAEMDWKTFSAKSLKSYQVFADKRRELFATLVFDAAKNGVNVSIPVVKKEIEFLSVAHLPVHIYNFDFGSLNFAFAHLKSPKKSFTIGIADPTFKNEGDLMQYRGEATIEYIGEEKRNDVVTRKYKIDGKGLENRGGYIWVNKAKNYFEDAEIKFPDNPEWTSFKLKLLKTEKMSRADWEKFIAAQF